MVVYRGRGCYKFRPNYTKRARGLLSVPGRGVKLIAPGYHEGEREKRNIRNPLLDMDIECSSRYVPPILFPLTNNEHSLYHAISPSCPPFSWTNVEKTMASYLPEAAIAPAAFFHGRERGSHQRFSLFFFFPPFNSSSSFPSLDFCWNTSKKPATDGVLRVSLIAASIKEKKM